MKFFNTLALALPAAQAMPGVLPRHLPTNGVEIRDEATLEKLRASHAYTLEALRNQTRAAREGHSDHDKRLVIFGLGGFAFIEVAGALGGTIAGLQNKLLKMFTGDDQEQIWHNWGYCRTYFQTQGGGNCETRTYDREAQDATAVHTDGPCAWNDPENNDPPVVFYEGDQGIGKYSIQYTATDKYAWDGLEGTETCAPEGLCNPSYVFYREGYNMILNTWQSQGEISACQYSGGEDCKGLCSSGVKDQFQSGGVVWGGDCAIPCESDTELPEQ